MKSSTDEIIPIIGTALAGGFFAGRIRVDGQAYALIVAPKATGERSDVPWTTEEHNVLYAQSFCDGLLNTKEMADAGSELAKWALSLTIGDSADWYLPSQDELEIIYRNLKPTTRENYCYARSGINLAAIEPTSPYTPGFPVQTQADAFKATASEAFEPSWYWSSTQSSAYTGSAWIQVFSDGYQDGYRESYAGRARAVRRFKI
jgi:hypothetical protein